MPATIDDFIRSLSKEGRARGVVVSRWAGSRRQSPNIVQVKGPKDSILLYVKARGSGKGFWGLNPNQLNALGMSSAPTFVVLLKTEAEAGYILDRAAVMSGLEKWKIGHDSEYKVNEAADVESIVYEQNYSELQHFILDAVASAN